LKKYFRAKTEFYYWAKSDMLKASTEQIEKLKRVAEERDPTIERRADFMFSFLDYDNDRYKVREKFIKEMNKKTTLDDIGKALDKFIVDEKGDMLEYWQPSREEKIKSASKDSTNMDFSWAGQFFKDLVNPLTPSKFTLILSF
jgi:hypothetical protein